MGKVKQALMSIEDDMGLTKELKEKQLLELEMMATVKNLTIRSYND